jgi:hypothetical protein
MIEMEKGEAEEGLKLAWSLRRSTAQMRDGNFWTGGNKMDHIVVRVHCIS